MSVRERARTRNQRNRLREAAEFPRRGERSAARTLCAAWFGVFMFSSLGSSAEVGREVGVREPLSSELGTYETVQARFGPWLSSKGW